MPLRLLLGRAGSGKTHRCLEEMRTRLEDDPGGPPLFYVVPETMTFQAERALALLPGLDGFARVRVVSFSRLAQAILQEAGGSARPRLDDAGLALAVRRAMEACRDVLGSLGRLADSPALVAHLAALYRECRRCGVPPERLAREAQALREGGDGEGARLAGKLDMLARLFGEVERLLGTRYALPEDALWRCAWHLEKAPVVRDAEVWVDGFAVFAPHEWVVLEGLIAHSRGVTVALCLDPRMLEGEGEADDLDVFAPVRETAVALRELAMRRGIPVEVIALPEEGKGLPRFARRDDLAHLARTFEGWPALPYPDAPRAIRLWAAASRQAEVEGAAREIVRLVREEGYCWGDVAVLVGDEAAYFPHLERAFTDYGIPVFFDGRKALRQHPLVELLRAAADVVAQGWPHEAVFRCLKSDLLFPPREAERITALREQVARLENICLAHGIEGRAWTMAEPWPELEADPALDDLRRRLVAPLQAWEEALSAAETVRDVAAAILRFFEASGVPDHLARWAAEAEVRGDLDEALEHADAWETAVRLLDQLVALMGSLRLRALPVVRLYVACLESTSVRRVPPSRDQVLAGRFDRSRVPNAKCVFFLGLNEGVMAPRERDGGLLAEDEREQLRARGVALAPSVHRRLAEAQLAVYEALASATDRLYLSYALADEEGNAAQPATVIKRIRALFPRLAEEAVPDEATSGAPGALPLTVLWGPALALRGLAVQLRRARDGQPVEAVWGDVCNWLVAHPVWGRRVRTVARAAAHRNEEGPLAAETRGALYGPVLTVSPSRLETFAACPFRHFAAYVLRLEPRRLARLEAADVGTLLHAALRIAVERLWTRGGWAATDAVTCRELAEDAVAQAARETGVAARLRTRRMSRGMRGLARVVADSLAALAEQGRRGAFRPMALEAPFGAGQALPGLRLQLSDGTPVELVGRIDRVDFADVGGKRYVRVIDYKTGAATVSLAQVVHGLALQLPLYLEVALAAAEAEGQEAVPAGMFLFRPHRPLVDGTKARDDADVDRLRLRAFRLRGFVTADGEAAGLLDAQWESGHSDVVPGYRKKDGTVSGRGTDAVLTADQWAVLRRFVRAKAARLAEDLASGAVAIAPYQLKAERACARCPYRPVCQFDALIDASRVRPLADVGGEAAWMRMSEEGREGDAHRSPETGGQPVDR